MPQWGPFLAVVALLTALLLALARQSQEFIRDHAAREENGIREESDRRATDGTHAEGMGAVVDTGDTPDRHDRDTPDRHGAPVGSDRPGADVRPDDRKGSGAGTDSGTGSDPGAGTGPEADAGPSVDPSAGGISDERGAQRRGESTDGHDGTVEGAPLAGTSRSDDVPEERGETHPGREFELTSRVMLANVASTQAIVVVIVLVAGWYFSIPASAFGVTADALAGGLPGVGVGVAFGVVLWLANELSTTVADAVGAAYDETVRELLAPASARGWVGLLLVVLPLIALAEELLFRAALIGVPAAGFDVSPWLLAVVASLAFALGHGAQGRVGIVVTGVLGLVLAAGYILTGSLLVVVVAHYVINALEFLLHERLGVEDVWPLVVRSG